MSKSEKEKMLAGELYLANDPELEKERGRKLQILYRFNNLRPEEYGERESLLQSLCGALGKNVVVEPPFLCDYGYNVFLGDRVHINYNCVFLDVGRITIGDDTLIAPNVQLYSATHPLDWRIRHAAGPELGEPITIGKDCWLGGGVIVCPGVSIGDRSVIGAGSVVTRDIPPGVLAVGNPCRVIRTLT